MYNNIDQKRALDASHKIRALQAEPPKYSETWRVRYANRVDGLGASILMNGLGQTMASLLAASRQDKDSADYMLYVHIQDWLMRKDAMAPYGHARSRLDLMVAITHEDLEYYRRAQYETLAWLAWLKKFCRAYIKPGKE